MKTLGLDYVVIFWVSMVHISAFICSYYVPMKMTGCAYMWIMAAYTGVGITVGYHRLWSHGSYKCSLLWQIIMAVGGAGALEGSIFWWTKLHRVHHNFSDTDIDPYGPQHGFWWAHCGWMFYKKDRTDTFKRIDMSDLKRDWLVMLQHKLYVPLALFAGFILPMLIFSDTIQAAVYGGLMSRVLTWHSTWCINSVQHWLGASEFSDELTAKDSYLGSLLTLGEGNHAFHHAFPFSYKNAINWYDWDPSGYLIKFGSYIGQTWDLRVVDPNELKKSRYQVLMHRLRDFYQEIQWPDPALKEIEISFSEYKEAAKHASGKVWITIDNFVYDVTAFAAEHPGGEGLLKAMAGKSSEYTTQQFHYRNNHSMSARNTMESMLIGKLVQ